MCHNDPKNASDRLQAYNEELIGMRGMYSDSGDQLSNSYLRIIWSGLSYPKDFTLKLGKFYYADGGPIETGKLPLKLRRKVSIIVVGNNSLDDKLIPQTVYRYKPDTHIR